MAGYAYAEISVNSPIAQRRTFTYHVPADLNLDIGEAVWVPFGDKNLQGIVIELSAFPLVAETRDIIGVIDGAPLLSKTQICLARWLSDYYLAPLFEAVALMLPPGFERRTLAYISRYPGGPEYPESLTLEQNEIIGWLREKEKINFKELEKKFGSQRSQKIVTQLIHLKLVKRNYELENLKVKPRLVPHLGLKVTAEEAHHELGALSSRARKQADLLRNLVENSAPVAISTLKSKADFSSSTISSLVARGLAEVRLVRQDRDPLASLNINLSFPLSLTSAQDSVFKAIVNGMQNQLHFPNKPKVFLLSGVTGSGKTEIYLQALKEAVKIGKKGVVLVPEISMTPQVIERFISRFPGRVAVLHSELSLGEQYDEWWRIQKGEFDVVIGPRSAIFAPQPDLGLIIIDEEHEWTYKQQDISPRYHTRRVAVKLAELTGATLVLGSATPDVESYYKALNGEWRLLELMERVTPEVGSPLPQVEIVDLKEELKSGNYSYFSRSLYNAINTALKNQEQIILFLNRRGSASFVECRDCGWVIRCKRCGVPLSYHSAEEMLLCHQCNYHMRVPQICPRCRSRRIKYLGVGTEKLELETAQAFPRARVLRWDSDVVKGRTSSHQEVFNKFKAGKADILIGTQMIAKGLDFPGVTLVGVICADIALNLPDFRAGERAFQLLSQVAGRAGRGAAGGKVIVQTYSPQHYAIQSAVKQDYPGFYQQEIAYRRELHNPPFSCLARMTFLHTNENRCREEVERIKRIILEKTSATGLTGINLIGPAPSFIHKLRGRFSWQLILRSDNPSEILSSIELPRGWSIDIDPVGL